MSSSCQIAIVGGGLAGLAAAQALKTFGMQAQVFEAAPALGEIGAAVNVSPQAVKALQAIGLRDKIAAVAHMSPGIYTRNMQTGEFLEFNDRFKTAERYGAPYYTFHRADLLDALGSGLDRSAIHLGHRLTGLEERSDRVILSFENGARVDAEIVIGADGIRSVVRRSLYGDDNPTYTGQMVWRALLNASEVPEEVLAPKGHTQWVGPGCHFIAYYIRRGKLVNIVTQQDTDKWVEEGWSIRGDPDEMRLSFPNPEPRLAEAAQPRDRVLQMGTIHAAPHAELGPRTHPAHRRRGACHAAQCRTRRLPGVRGLPTSSGAGSMPAPIRSKPLPISVASASRACMGCSGFPCPMSASSTCATARLKRTRSLPAKSSVYGSSEWVWGYDPVGEWDKEPSVPTVYAA